MRRIIKRLTDLTLLHHYDTAMPLAIDVDTSIEGVGYVAYMYDPSNGPPGPDNAKLIKYGSASSKPTWANYSPIELEATLLAVRKLQQASGGAQRPPTIHPEFQHKGYQSGVTQTQTHLPGTG